jgi:hypothetical protein
VTLRRRTSPDWLMTGCADNGHSLVRRPIQDRCPTAVVATKDDRINGRVAPIQRGPCAGSVDEDRVSNHELRIA